ncbi:putative rhamnogalacturonase E [Lachnellula willkommii]|uniref:Putative rhamnogalacturonase E n=1 Tax=Lachnellula willkommii TaxID=215461 RepID=A0A559MDH3_9HELO|nr:putative rhamnogalacturonase E [Lachnellula willkommii]
MHTSLSWFLGFFLLAAPAYAQLIGHVGVTTPLNQKRHECNILQYGGVSDNKTDVAPAIHLAFEKCVKHHPGSRLIVPPGNYLLKQSVQLINGTNWAFQLDGLITAQYGGSYDIPREVILQGFAGVDLLNSTINGEGDGLFLLNLIVIVNAIDFEFYSGNGRGAIQGQGVNYRNLNITERPRMLRLVSPINSTIHDLLLIDSPKFHFVFDFGLNIEVYHLTIRGADLGTFDGIDAIGTNYYVHDNEVTNRDECVSVKSPSHHALIENNVCNRVGSGISIGSLNVSAEISNIHARNISVLAASEIAFIKTYPGGSGYVTNITFENFRSKASLSGAVVNQYWQFTTTPDTGAVFLSNITFRNFSGSIIDGVAPGKSPINDTEKPALYLIANDLTGAINITVEDVSVWTESGGDVINHISNFYGTGDNVYGPNDGLEILAPSETPTPYSTAYTITASPTGWVQPPAPTWIAASTGWGTSAPIPVYTPAALWKPEGDYDKHYWGSF